MTAHDTADERVQGRETEPNEDGRSGIGSVLSTALRSDASGSLAIVAGGAILTHALRSIRQRPWRAIPQAVLGVGLLGYGLQNRQAADSEPRDIEQESAEAAAHLEQGKVLHQSEENPRGISDEADVEQQTDAGNVEFTEDQDSGPHNEPHLDSEGDIDPRTEAGEELSGDEVDIDLSEASMADEASEATGPNAEQSQPSTTQGTEPEPTPDADVQAPNAEETGGGQMGVADDGDHGEMDRPDDERENEADDEAPEPPFDEADAVEPAAEPIDSDAEHDPEAEATERDFADGERDADESDSDEDE